MQAEVSVTQVGDSDRVTNDQSLLSQLCDIFLNMAQTVRYDQVGCWYFQLPPFRALSLLPDVCYSLNVLCMCAHVHLIQDVYMHLTQPWYCLVLIHSNIIYVGFSLEDENMPVVSSSLHCKNASNHIIISKTRPGLDMISTCPSLRLYLCNNSF